LQVDRLYHGVDGPVSVTVGPVEGDSVELVLMAADGSLLSAAVSVTPGRLDVSTVLPEVLGLSRACYLQCIVGGQPAGSALVIQPLLGRVAPRTEQARRPDGTPYTRIVGWGPAPVEDDAQPEQQPAPVSAGLRVYIDRDVVLQTTHGEIVVAMRPDVAPNTVWNFLHLVEGGYYDGVSFHRVVPLTRQGHPFVIQGGDPSGTGEGEPGYWLPIEPSSLAHEFGVISMARSDNPDSAGGQFFFCLSRAGTARLDGQYCAFGYAVDGANTIRGIAAVELADVASGRPADPPVVTRAGLLPAPPRTPGVGRPDRPVSESRAPQSVETQPDRIPR
jgi:peptidyl-prolyl cis-trans isomerase B (cyclophilin B)